MQALIPPSNQVQMQVGDLLTVFRFPYTHTGILYDRDLFGPLVLTNTPSKGEHLCRWEEFSRGQEVAVHSSQHRNRQVLWLRMQQVLSQPRPYDLWTRNCEHTSNFILEGRAHSPQIQDLKAVGALSLIGIGLIAVSRA